MTKISTLGSLLLLQLALVLAGHLDSARAAILEPIYGEMDDRRDLWEVTDPSLLGLAASTAVLLPADDLEVSLDGRLKAVAGRSLQKRLAVCETERFSAQLSLSPRSCSGALVGPDLVLTAGHCVPDAQSCAGLRIVFGFGIIEEGAGDGEEVPEFAARDVYSCRALVSPAYGPDGRKGPDFAVIRLDRRVKGRKPLAISRTRVEIQPGTRLAIIGHPSGLPTKVAAGASVSTSFGMDLDTDYFYSDLDSYYGNSGSPVFNIRTGLIEGVLVNGDEDFEQGRKGNCRVSRRCMFGVNCQGEKSIRISIAAPFIPRAGR